ncbi:restriction endonuclease subunit S [Enterobacter wuhouensis]
MSYEFSKVSLKQISSKIGDGIHGTPIYDENGSYYFINGNNLGSGRIVITSSTKKVSREEYLKHKKELNESTVLLSINGTIGNVSLFNDEPVILGKSACYINVLPNVSVRYIGYVLKDRFFQNYIKQQANGSTIKNVSLKLIRDYEFTLPPRLVQDRIAEILSSLDKKISVNENMSEILEQMAQALFKSWFVDFEPVKAKMAVLEAGGSQEDATFAAMSAISGKDADALAVLQREHPEQYAELKATAELFPSAIQESDQGCIPEGWEYRKIGDYIDNISKTYPLKKVEQVVFLNTGDIKEGAFLHQNKLDVGSLPGQAKKSIKEGDILYSEIRPVNKRFAFVYFNADEYVVSTKLMVLRPKSKELSYYLYFLLSSNEVVSYLQLMAESRSGTFPQITYDTVSDIKMLTSTDESVIKSFCKFVGENLYIPQQSIIKQNDMLTNIRDTLLPKLLSGEIALPEAEQAVSEAENV